MTDLSKLLVFVWATLGLAACAAEELGPEFSEISESESVLVFTAPGLENGYRKFLYGQGRHFLEITYATYGPPKGSFPHANIQLIETPPDRHFTRISPPSEAIEDWDLFKGKTITKGPGGRAVNGIGSYRYLAFTADDLACVVWKQPFGRADNGGVGTGLVSGYYCRKGNTMMSDGEAAGIPKGLDRRETGA